MINLILYKNKRIELNMGNEFIDMQTNNYIPCDPFTPIYFLPKITEAKSEQVEISSNLPTAAGQNSFKLESVKSLTKRSNKENNLEDEKNENTKDLKRIIEKLELNSYLYDNYKSNKSNIDNYYLKLEEQKNMSSNSLYSKLLNKFKKCKNSNINNLFIFDWDNTLLPTYYLAQENILNDNELPLKYLEIFSFLEERIFKLLLNSIKKGDVYIITNSSIGWVEFSANNFFPGLSKLFKYINIISARDEYKDIYPNDVKIWKEKVFLSLKETLNINFPTNIICFGDSYIELNAGKKLGSEIKNCFVKTIKFKEHPEPEDIINQINLIINKFDYIFSKQKNLSVTIKQIETK